jgi:glutathione peroxidase
MSKIKVTGKKKAKIYQYLTDESLNGFQSSKVKWNFQKYLIDENGYLIKILGTKVKPNDGEIIKWIEDIE